jgi:hypothetical protein
MASEWRTLRIFISSTFRDMQAERDHLVRFVFPQLREDLLKRRIHLVDVDLRWGVTADQDAFELCMDEIDRCHPRFICMLGGRYGWVPPGAERSITASEVHYAVLDRVDQAGFRFFYFRDPHATASIPDPAAAGYRELEGSSAAERLASLKDRIRRSRARTLIAPGEQAERPLSVFEYPCRWDPESSGITGLEAFGSRVYLDLQSTVEAEFGAAAPAAIDEFDEENSAMESFIESRVERYVVGSREPVFAELRRHAAGSEGSGVLLVVGEPGSGKSALLGRFCREHAERAAGSGLLVSHFVGATATSTNIRQMLRRLCRELHAGAGSTAGVPEDWDELQKAFAAALAAAAASRRVALVIDAVNQLDPALQAHSMRWLPENLPSGVCVILSALPGPALDALRTRSEPVREIALEPLAEADAAAIIDAFLLRYRKQLDRAQRAALLSKPDSGKPLYLLTALEELRTLGGYEEITARIDSLPGETLSLFAWILERLERDPGFRDAQGRLIGADLVRSYCSYVAAGRAGMAQSELVELIAPGDPMGNVAALYRLLRPYLMSRGELLDFFHGQLREAVQTRYLSAESDRLVTHRTIATYFRGQADPAGDATWSAGTARAFSELPYHQTEANLWEDLHRTLTDLGFLEAKCTLVAVTTSGGDTAPAVYGGVYELQEDYRRALERMPA